MHAKADPIEDFVGARAMSPSAFDAAVDEFNGGDVGSDSEFDDE